MRCLEEIRLINAAVGLQGITERSVMLPRVQQSVSGWLYMQEPPTFVSEEIMELRIEHARLTGRKLWRKNVCT